MAIRRGRAAARVAVARFAAVFDIDPEEHRTRGAAAAALGEVADAGEADLVGRRLARLRAAGAGTGIAKAADDLATMDALRVRRLLTNDDAQARAAAHLGFSVLLPR